MISAVDSDDIYKIPMLLHEQDLDDIVIDKLRLNAPPTDLAEWRAVVAAKQNPEAVVDIGMVGKYVQIRDSYISLNEALMHGGIKTRTRVNIHYFESQDIERSGPPRCRKWMPSWCRAASATAASRAKSRRSALRARTAFRISASVWGCSSRSSNIARNVLALKGANSTEFDRATNHPVIALITEWQDLERGQQVRDEKSDLGGSMRLGAQEAKLMPGSLARAIYGKESIFERHRHRYEFNNHYLDELTAAGLTLLGFLGRRSGGIHRIAQPSVVRRQPVPPGIHLDAPRWPPVVRGFRTRGARISGLAAAGPRHRMKLYEADLL